MSNRPIGVFDSGVGGLTVLKEIKRLLPGENIVYYGDTARVPYGTRSRREILKLTRDAVSFLLARDIKALVIACNTATAVAFRFLISNLDIPVIGVIDPGTRAIMGTDHLKRLGIIATEATVDSKAYERKLKRDLPDLEVYSQACPMLVSIVEEGWGETDIATYSVRKYLANFEGKDLDALLLACTHFPVLRRQIVDYLGPDVLIIDPAEKTASDLKEVLEEKDIKNHEEGTGTMNFYVTGTKCRFEKLAESILEEENLNIVQVID